MIFKTPSFWYRKKTSPASWQELLLKPLSGLYAYGHRFNQARKTPYKASIPVICVGNAVAGGSGKTPTAIALCNLLKMHQLSQNPAFLTRGYGGSIKDPAIVTQDLSFEQTGDESLLLSRHGMTVIARDRKAGADFAASNDASLLILDDGLQNRSLRKDLSFMVIDGASGLGNGNTLPAGPLREPLNEAFDKTDAFILVGKDMRGVTALLPEDKPLFQAHVEPRIPDDLDLSEPHIAFAGLGRPEKFYHLLQHLDANIAGWHEFPDHYPYKQEDLNALAREAQEKGAGLLTTEKDLVRLRHLQSDIAVQTLPIEIVFEDEQPVVDFLCNALKLPA